MLLYIIMRLLWLTGSAAAAAVDAAVTSSDNVQPVLIAAGSDAQLQRGDPDFTSKKGYYCVGCHPGPPIYTATITGAACEATCKQLDCACYDFDGKGENKTAVGTCRITNTTTAVKESHAGFNAFVHDGWIPGPPPLPPPTAALTATFSEGPGRPLQNFWHSCGWCPPDPHPDFPSYFAREDLAQNHLLIGSVPHTGIKYVRIHYLLDLIKLLPATTLVSAVPDGAGYRFSSAAGKHLAGVGLNFTALDAAMDQLHTAGLYPGFEIMGNPGNNENRTDRLFTDFSDHKQIIGWKELVHTVAARYIERYGVDVVRQWRWESWNEPDGQCGRDLTVGITCNIPAFLAYYDACSAGLMEADPHLIFGGPASDGKKEFLFALVGHCLNGTNAITGEVGCGARPSFFNAHLKGSQSSYPITAQELPIAEQVAQMIKDTALEGVPWGNDEADPKVHWSSSFAWRADSRYAAMVPKVVAQHLDAFVSGATLGEHFHYDVLSNDNGFLPYPDNNQSVFAQRTLVARFAMNHSKPPTVELVRKPVLNAMALMSKLGSVHFPILGGEPASTARLGGIATLKLSVSATSPHAMSAHGERALPGAQEAAVVLYSSDDSAPSNPNSMTTVNLTLSGLPGSLRPGTEAAVAVWLLDDLHGNAHTVWEAQGRPLFPTPAQFAAMRNASELSLAPGFPRKIDSTSVTVPMRTPSVALVHVCSSIREGSPPTAPRLRKTTTPGTTVVRWSELLPDSGRCVAKYIVQQGPSPTGRSPTCCNNAGWQDGFRPVNDPDPMGFGGGTIFNSFIHADTGGCDGCCYRVMSRDYWGAVSPPSNVTCP